MGGEVKATPTPSGLPRTSVHSSPASLPPSKSQASSLSSVLPPSLGSTIAEPPVRLEQSTWYWMSTRAGSVQAPAPVLLPRVKVLVVSLFEPTVYFHSAVKVSAEPPVPMV